MKALLFPILLLFPLLMPAQGLNEYQWKSRVLLMFTPEADDPLFLRQYQLLSAASDELEDRKVQIIFISPEGKYENTGLFLDESRSKYYYDRFNPRPYQFEMVLVGLDSQEKFRARNIITPVAVLLNLIDEMPMRRREIMQGYGNKSQLDRENDNKRAKQRY